MMTTGFTTADDKDNYTYIMNRYKKEGLDMFFYDASISDSISLKYMDNKQIIDCIGFLSKSKSYSQKAWYEVLNDALIRKRELKIQKIKKNIN